MPAGGRRPPQPLTLLDVWPYAVLLGILLIATVLALKQWPLVGFVGAWVFITLAPTSSIVPIATEVGAERRMYLPLAAIVTLAVTGTWLIWHRVAPRRVTRGLPLVFALKTLIPLFALLMALQGISQVIRALAILRPR